MGKLITININDNFKPLFIEALAKHYGYRKTITIGEPDLKQSSVINYSEIENPESGEVFVIKKIEEYLLDLYKRLLITEQQDIQKEQLITQVTTEFETYKNSIENIPTIEK